MNWLHMRLKPKMRVPLLVYATAAIILNIPVLSCRNECLDHLLICGLSWLQHLINTRTNFYYRPKGWGRYLALLLR